jgi:hypothetical protein
MAFHFYLSAECLSMGGRALRTNPRQNRKRPEDSSSSLPGDFGATIERDKKTALETAKREGRLGAR